MSETVVESEFVPELAPDGVSPAIGVTQVWMAAGKQKLSGALQWLAQSLTRASTGLSTLATRVDAVGSSLVAK